MTQQHVDQRVVAEVSSHVDDKIGHAQNFIICVNARVDGHVEECCSGLATSVMDVISIFLRVRSFFLLPIMFCTYT